MLKTNNVLISFYKANKLISIVIIVAIIGGGLGIYYSAKSATSASQYVVTRAKIGSITQTVSGSGQVSAENQLDITSQVSGSITSIAVKVGQHVNAGDLIATIDNTSALNNLESARISLAQVTEPAKPGDIANARNTLNKSYTDAANSLRSTFSDLQTVMAGINTMLYDRDGFLSPTNSSSLSTEAHNYTSIAGKNFDQSKNEYQKILHTYSTLTNDSSQENIESVSKSVVTFLSDLGGVLKDLQTAVVYIVTYLPDYNPKSSATAITNVTSWISSVNTDLSSISGAYNSIQSNENTLTELMNGSDELTIKSAQLSLSQAEKTYSNYFIRAPFDGIVGRIPVSLYGQASASTIIATIVGDKKVSTISLDEVDAAKVSVGQPVTVSLDAVSDLKATGTVSVVDLVGTISGGVVSYNVKISIDTEDPRIRPGMSLNSTIITNKKQNVIVVPSSAVKSQLIGGTYVQVLENVDMGNRFASSTNRAVSGPATMTITTDTKPVNVAIKTGLNDDTNTEIVSGLNGGEVVVVRSTTSSLSTNTPNILTTLGARAGAGGTTRTTTARPAGN